MLCEAMFIFWQSHFFCILGDRVKSPLLHTMLRLLTFLTVLAYCTSFQPALKANSASRIPGSSRVPVLAQSSVTSSTPAVSNVNDEINGTGMIKRKAKVLKEPNLWEYNL